MRGEGGVAGEGRVVSVPKFHSLACHKRISTQIGCPMLLLDCVFIYIILGGSFKLHLGV